MENIESWTGKYLDIGEIVPESLCNNFCKGDILFGKLRPYLSKAYIAEENGTCSSEILVFRTSSILRRYLFYLPLHLDRKLRLENFSARVFPYYIFIIPQKRKYCFGILLPH